MILVGILASAVSAFADTQSDDPVLDARIDLFVLNLNIRDTNPRIAEAKARLDILSRTFSESSEDYRKHIVERLQQAEMEEGLAKLNYTDANPKRMQIEAKLKYIQQLLQESTNSETVAANSNPGLNSSVTQQVP